MKFFTYHKCALSINVICFFLLASLSLSLPLGMSFSFAVGSRSIKCIGLFDWLVLELISDSSTTYIGTIILHFINRFLNDPIISFLRGHVVAYIMI